MATVRDNLTTVLEGGTPERTPLSIYDWNMGAITSDELAARMKEDAWKRLLDLGLGVTAHCEIIEAVEHGVETIVEEREDDGAVLRIVRKRTPEGEIRKASRNGWHYEDWIKEPHDYRIARWIVEHTGLQPRYERFARCEEIVGDRGLVILTGSGNWLHRTPLMKINIDWAGTEQFCTDLALEVPELSELHEALKEQFLAEQRLLAAAPGRYVKWLENLTIGMIGPRRYRELLVPVYREGSLILESGGKRVMVHYDGQLNVIADQIAAAPFAIIESVTEPPEGDMTYDACRACWPDKVLWANLNAGVYQEPPDMLRQTVISKRQRAGKRALAFEISEALPPTWKETVPVILKALDELT
ncbi:MAG: hypothetical protein HUU20_09425 [Pirellulales bacterium]|nr:hypothetical protein [Pirellulales bacterium]